MALHIFIHDHRQRDAGANLIGGNEKPEGRHAKNTPLNCDDSKTVTVTGDPPAVGRPFTHEGKKYRVKAVNTNGDKHTVQLEDI